MARLVVFPEKTELWKKSNTLYRDTPGTIVVGYGYLGKSGEGHIEVSDPALLQTPVHHVAHLPVETLRRQQAVAPAAARRLKIVKGIRCCRRRRPLSVRFGAAGRRLHRIQHFAHILLHTGLVKTRVFLKKPAQWVFLLFFCCFFVFFGFFGFGFYYIFAQKREFFRVFSVSRILLGASRL
jgi:hypothetical protein